MTGFSSVLAFLCESAQGQLKSLTLNTDHVYQTRSLVKFRTLDFCLATDDDLPSIESSISVELVFFCALLPVITIPTTLSEEIHARSTTAVGFYFIVPHPTISKHLATMVKLNEAEYWSWNCSAKFSSVQINQSDQLTALKQTTESVLTCEWSGGPVGLFSLFGSVYTVSICPPVRQAPFPGLQPRRLTWWRVACRPMTSCRGSTEESFTASSKATRRREHRWAIQCNVGAVGSESVTVIIIFNICGNTINMPGFLQ